VAIPRVAFLNEISVANVQGIASIPTVRLERKLGTLPETTMIAIRRALCFALNLPFPAG
jgi:mRNA interferase MazF